MSGFDLAESPLLEVTRGKGRIVFCQLDVSNRYGTDPVATQLVDNLFAYMTRVGEPDPEKSAVAHLPVDGKTVVGRKQSLPRGKAGRRGWMGDHTGRAVLPGVYLREQLDNGETARRRGAGAGFLAEGGIAAGGAARWGDRSLPADPG